MLLNSFKGFGLGKIAGIVTGILISAVLMLNSYTTVQAGHVKVQSLFGKVVDSPLTEGLHIVNPLKSFDTISVRNDKYEVNALNIPTQDRFNSTGNVTVLYRIDGSMGNFIKQNYGTAKEYIDKTLRQQLRSIVRDEGRKMKDSRSLAQSENVSMMQVNTLKRLVASLDGTGIIIDEVLVQDIEFDPRIAQQILSTQQRIQKEEERKSQERIAETNTAIARLEAEADGNRKREQAKAEAFRITADAEARKAASIAQATGRAESRLLEAKAEADAIKLIADANLDLTKSLTPAILKKQELDNEAVLYSKSKGNVPTTIIGETNLRAIGVPVASSGQ
ncbi:hypothetical protein VPBG_00202 [Vibrio phage helene 12B3]|uniref:lipoprotein n=1 Tax=Vibrio phage helene 12B3 TaxID=573173 RepID=UPI0002C0967E|nr:lipoprotein [Vibrio phage helene 12B3]YP_009223071.1 lipoprotein [Vibrio phage eugene 12A10]AGG57974.1 hypothetical protein VPBG_00202 [Vibrio phage helene 12B3]AGN51661.1 hypothetical protein VPLG_00222 [Vibrio phage eugene 12A10]